MSKKLLFRLAVLMAAMMCALGAAAAEAYACYTESNTTLTFYYDNLRSSRTGTTYDLNVGSARPDWDDDGSHVTKVDFNSTFAGARPTSTYSWFYMMENLQSITGLNYLNTSQVTNMASMFSYCYELTSLDLSSFNTSRVTNMGSMFHGSYNLRTIYAGSGWSTAAVTYSANMFFNCPSLVGGQGTTYSESNPKDKTYARIDGGTSNPGYFTDPNAPIGYTCYTPENTTLTFYYDNQRSSRTGTTYDLNTGYNYPSWYDDGTNRNVTRVVFNSSFAAARPKTTSNWFLEMENLQSITGMSYLNTSEVTNMQNMFTHCNKLTSLDLSHFNTAKVTSMRYLFSFCYELTSLDLSSFSTANVTDMGDMFSGCTGLTSLDLSSFNTAKVTNMYRMFSGCTGLTNLDLSGFNTFQVIQMSGMFNDCSGLRNVNLSSFNTAQLQYMVDMFKGCSNLITIYANNSWSTAAVISSDNMFHGCTRLVGGMGTTYDANHVDKTYAHIDGGPSDPGYFTDVNAPALIEAYATYVRTTLTLHYDDQRHTISGRTYLVDTGNNEPEWYTEGINAYASHVVIEPSFADYRPTSTASWFEGMTNLQTIEGLGYLNTSEVTNMNFMFSECGKLASLDLSGFDTHKVNSMFKMFCFCNSLQTIYVSNAWNTDAVTESGNMFWGCTSLVGEMGTTYDVSHDDKRYAHIDGGPSNPGYFTRDPNSPEPYACYTPSNTTLTFYYDNQRDTRPGTTYDLNSGMDNPGWYSDGSSYGVTKVVFDPSFASARPTSTYHWFAEMYDLTSIEGMQYLNTSEVTNMASMFWECGALPAVDVSGFDTRKVTDMSAMFAECYELTALDVSGWNTSYVTDMSWMFSNCSELASLDVSHFNTSNVTNMRQLFDGCSGLTSLDVSNFDTSNVTDMSYMFTWCKGLQQLDLSGFNTSKVTNMSCMFNECDNLRTIYVGDGWTTAAVTSSSYMFDVCYSLVGGKGTAYSSSNPKDKTYAHIDGGTSNPGYFSEWKEAYACYTSTNTTLTFYYDDQRTSRPGTTYDLNTDDNDTGWDTDGTNANVTKVVFNSSFASARPTTTCDWFYGMTNLESITGMEYLNTSEVTNMDWMFLECSKLTSVDVSHFNTSKVTSMYSMFNSCTGLTSLDLSSFNTSNVTDMRCMFKGCTNLQTIYVGNGWSTAAVTGSANMFYNCTSLVGGQGTTYNAIYVDKTYAHIDGGPSNPGYFSEKGGTFLRGDVNGDGSVNISDVTALIDYLLTGNASGINLSGADCNQDSSVNISDVTALIDYLLSSHW